MKIFVVAMMAAAGAATALPQARAQQKSYLVTAIAEGGAPVTDLTAKDVIVTEGGERREVVSVARPPFPLAVSLLVDTTQAPPGMNMLMRELRTALSTFVATVRATSPGARMQLVEVAGGAVTTASFDAPPEALDAAVQRIFPAHPSDAVFLEAIGAAARTMTPMPTPRRAIVTVDFNSSESLNEGTVKRMSADLSQSGATVWSVSVRLPRSSMSRREDALNRVTKNSGGLRLVASASSGLEALLEQVAASLASQYLVDFTRPGDGPMKPVQMATTRGVRIHMSPMSR